MGKDIELVISMSLKIGQYSKPQTTLIISASDYNIMYLESYSKDEVQLNGETFMQN